MAQSLKIVFWIVNVGCRNRAKELKALPRSTSIHSGAFILPSYLTIPAYMSVAGAPSQMTFIVVRISRFSRTLVPCVCITSP
jgi:hypothetical protein